MTVNIKTIEQNLIVPAGADMKELSLKARELAGGCELVGLAGVHVELKNPGTGIPWLEGRRRDEDVMSLEVRDVLEQFDTDSYVVVLDLDEAMFYRFERQASDVVCRRWNPMHGGRAFIPFGAAYDLDGSWRW